MLFIHIFLVCLYTPNYGYIIIEFLFLLFPNQLVETPYLTFLYGAHGLLTPQRTVCNVSSVKLPQRFLSGQGTGEFGSGHPPTPLLSHHMHILIGCSTALFLELAEP